jgi:hypothetical protein
MSLFTVTIDHYVERQGDGVAVTELLIAPGVDISSQWFLVLPLSQNVIQIK